MGWINELFTTPSALQTVVVLSLICSMGLALGKVRVGGISLGVAFVFFIGILAGHLGFNVDAQMLDYAETFGLVVFVYMLGLHVGPNFFGLLKHEGMELNLWSFAIILLGTAMAVGMVSLAGISVPDMVGVLCGATTNTPALGAAQQALSQLGLPSGSAALATAVTYPLGVLGVIVVMVLMRRFFVKPADLELRHDEAEDKTFIAQFVVVNPALADKTVASVSALSHLHFVISRVWRGEQVLVPQADTMLKLYDNILVVTNKDDVSALEMLFGEKAETDWNEGKIDWNHVDSKVESRILVLSRRVLNGKRLGQLQLRHTYGVNVSRVTRGDVKLLATDNLRLQYGDRLVVVGEPKALDNVESFLGNAVQTLNEPNVAAIFLGIILGLALGTIPLSLPGMSAPVRLGIAGGPIIMGIIVGSLGPRMHFISYTTRSASLMLRQLGLSLYLACLGLDAGRDFFQTVMRPEGVLWIGLGALLTMVPVLVVGLIALRTRRYDYGTICGILCGSMANPMALGYANDTTKGDASSIAYASVYPLGMFIRVLIAQMLIVFFAT
ncbi:MAG: putative transporter [Prevotella sp.]|nr:putative transporter [Prevotella sp.]